MRYFGKFRDRKDNLYTVTISVNDGVYVDRELTMGVPAFVSTMDKSDDNIYRPARYQSATAVFRVSEDINIYTGKPHGALVKLLRGDAESTDVAWIGYMSPETYSMGYTRPREDIDIECIDGLSSLQYIKYTTVGPEKSVATFVSIIRRLLAMCDCYTNFYISTATHLDGDAASIIERTCISEQNFFDEKDDVKQTDNDVAWTCQDVLEEICRYFGVTVVAYGTDVYFIDYDAVAKGINTYWMYDIKSSGMGVQVTLADPITITSELHASSDSTISHDAVYNSVKVKDSLYAYDSMIPDFFDAAVNITSSSDTALSSSTNVLNGMYGEVISAKIGDDGGTDNMIVFIDRIKNPQKNTYGDYNLVAAKYYNNPYYKIHRYAWNGTKLVEVNPETLNYTDTKTMYGASICRFDVRKLENTPSVIEEWVAKVNGKTMTLDEFMTRSEISKISLADYIILNNPNDHHITNENYQSYPYIETELRDATALFGGQNAYILISGMYYYHYFVDDPYPIPESEADISEGRYAMDAGQTYLMCKLQIGNLYWTGERSIGDNGWSTVESTFKILYINANAKADERRADATMFRNLEFVNTVSWRLGIDDEGYIIPMPKASVINGIPRLTIYKPFDPNYHSTKSGGDVGQHYKHSTVFLKDFKMQAVIGDPTFSGANDTDTEYRNVIDYRNASDFSDVEFKICTWDNKTPNYSAVGVLTNGNYSWLDETVNDALHDGELAWAAHDDDAPSDADGKMRQEEHLIYRLVTQYQKSAVRLQKVLRNIIKPYSLVTESNLAKSFIVDAQDVDYQDMSATVQLREMI